MKEDGARFKTFQALRGANCHPTSFLHETHTITNTVTTRAIAVVQAHWGVMERRAAQSADVESGKRPSQWRKDGACAACRSQGANAIKSDGSGA